MKINTVTFGDSFKLIKEIPDKYVDAIITDPPYDFTYFAKVILHEEFKRIAKNTIIVFSPPENQWIKDASQYLFWQKPISTKNTSKRYSRFMEMIFVYQLTDGPIWNRDRHWSQYTNIFKDLVDDASFHPNRKPPSLIERLIRNHTNVGDIILDPFAGSMVVPEMAWKLGRKYIAIEIDESYKVNVDECSLAE